MAEVNADSILGSVRKLIGSDTYFDQDLILHINSVFASLQQMGVGPEDGFAIEDETTVWSDYTGDTKIMNMVRSYMVLRVRLLFDNSTMSSYLMEQLRKECSEYEWRLNVACDKEGE